MFLKRIFQEESLTTFRDKSVINVNTYLEIKKRSSVKRYTYVNSIIKWNGTRYFSLPSLCGQMTALLYKFHSIMESGTMAVFWGWSGTKHNIMVTSEEKAT